MSKLELQQACFNNIKFLCTNYSKDSASRKNEEYLNKRLESLENQWCDFDERHAQLILEVEDKNINYFSDDIYNKTKEMYMKTRADIMKRLEQINEQKREVKFDLTDVPTEENLGDCQYLLNKQECNFNAIDRVMSKINMQLISEKWELEENLALLKSKWEPIDKLHWVIDFQLKGCHEQYYDLYNNIEQKYDELRKKINSKIYSTVHYQQSAPRLEIPEFSGSYQHWISFKNLFLETINNNPTINPAQKMQYLKTKLKGEAERLVQHLNISAENYTSCWDILSQRYDNRRLQFTSFMNAMLNLPSIQHPDAYNLKRMHDVITESLNGISNIGIDTATWDPIIVHLMSQKLDSTTYNEYMKDLQDHRELQNLSDFMHFLESKFMAYETMKTSKRENITSQKPSYSRSFNKNSFAKKNNYEFSKPATKSYHTSYGQCPCCDGNHVLMQCTKFIDMDTTQRNDTVTKLRLCKNCLFSHGNNECKSTKTCKECSMKHHTLLHKKQMTSNGKNSTMNRQQQTSSQSSSATHQPSSNHLSNDNTEILLTTVQLKVKAMDGSYITLRGLLDQGSQVNLITKNAAQRLRLPRKKLNATVSGIGSVLGDCKGLLHLSCKAIHSDYNFETQALIMKKLTNNLPNSTFENTNWPHLQNLKLADPEYNISRGVDLLLGADIYSEIILEGVLKGNNDSPVAQQTQLGWILCGKMKTLNCYVSLINMEELTKFWENEDIQNSNELTKDEQCETFYKETVRRASDGKYVVKMPICPDYKDKIGNSRSIAASQFFQLEKRLQKQHKLAAMYKDFIKEYQDLGHMIPSSQDSRSSTDCYLPHHGVLRENSETTKLRVVFNASQRNSSGYSLNSLLEKGPNLQKDIQTLIIKWRTYEFVITADIEKMYRCLWLDEEQQHLQKIIWRYSPQDRLQEFQLCTITYGFKCAPWLAMRTLKQLSEDDGDKYPAAAKALANEFYVDDLLSGHSTLQGAVNLRDSLIKLLKGGGMNLRKWASNHPSLLQGLSEDQISTNINFDFKNETSTKTLGLSWNHSSDSFCFNWPVKENSTRTLTKRFLLSEISKIYDPLGWLSPITISTKLIFQKIWISKLSWDEEVPENIKKEWHKLKSELQHIKNISLKRWVGNTSKNIELIGFCDASEKAYAAVIYSRVINSQGHPVITLITSRTRVAPLSQKTSLPRLELCGAKLLSDLMEKTKQALSDYDITTSAWCDSQVALAWIQGEPTRWDVYIANRVRSINRVIPAAQWRYVRSEQNPADCASRGLPPSKLSTFNLWWNGPDFLKDIKQEANSENTTKTFETDMGCIHHIQAESDSKNNQETFITTLLNKHSSMTLVTKVVAWMLRFITYTRNKMKPETHYLTAREMNAANEIIVKHIQQIHFYEEYKHLSNNKSVSKKSPIHKLDPFLDDNKVIRVGGRLRNSDLPLQMKNPVIVPHKGRFTQLLIEQSHLTTLHGGARLTLNHLRQRYWIVGGNRAVKTQLRRCIRCHRFKTMDNNQVMGNLPKQRITPCRAYTHTGVDYSGFVEVKQNKGRGVKTSKGYIAVFICMTTKATHIELASDLSTETFIAALQRFCARRGTPKHMYSDCGTNFIGAAKILRLEFEEFKKILTPQFYDELAKLEIEWHFNAPAWPSAGGLWEAAVKSMKHHLKRLWGSKN